MEITVDALYEAQGDVELTAEVMSERPDPNYGNNTALKGIDGIGG